MKTFREFKEYLIETTKGSTLFESVIIACLNNSNLSKEDFAKEILRDNAVFNFLKLPEIKKWKVGKAKTRKEQTDILYEFAQVCKKNIGNLRGDSGIGQSKKKVSNFWEEETGKGKDTSKTDIKIGNAKVSVKGPKAQLMSGKAKEAKATVLAAIENSGSSDEIKEKLPKLLDLFVDDVRSEGAEIDVTKLKKMSVKEAIKTGNKKAKMIVDKQEELKSSINEIFRNEFKSTELGVEFAYEAMTGNEKFGGNSMKQGAGDRDGLATHMLVWSYEMDKVSSLIPIDKQFSKMTAEKMNIAVDFKSGSYGPKIDGTKTKKGYDIYQTLRASVNLYWNKNGEINESFQRKMSEINNMLNEGLISENRMKELLGKTIDWVINKLTAAWRWLTAEITKIVEGAKQLISKSVSEAMKVFGVDVEVKGYDKEVDMTSFIR
jgi:hypothetical protein